MAYTNSSLATYSNAGKHRKYTDHRECIKGVILHHMAGINTAQGECEYFASTSRKVSANYCVGKDGDIGLCVEEKYRAWTTGGYNPDGYYVTIEVSNDDKTTWHVSDATIKATIRLIADIYRRNGIAECKFDGTKAGSNLMAHRWYAATDCPGEYLYGKFGYIADEVNKLLKAENEDEGEDGRDSYVVQTGVFMSKKNAEAYAKRLTAAGFPAIVKVRGDIDGDGDVDMEDVRNLLRRVIGLNG